MSKLLFDSQNVAWIYTESEISLQKYYRIQVCTGLHSIEHKLPHLWNMYVKIEACDHGKQYTDLFLLCVSHAVLVNCLLFHHSQMVK